MKPRVMRMRVVAMSALAAAVLATLQPAQSDEDMIVERTYIEMADGVHLAATLARPSTAGPFPTVVTYDPYAVGSSGGYGFHHPRFFVPRGYAWVAVSIRGTGCSGGEFDQVFSEQEARDGAAVVEWAATRPWSTGDVALVGASYPGINQFFVAAQHPQGLRAITPLDTLSDIYRDVVYPGGVFNPTFAAGWSMGFQPYFAAVDGPLGANADGDCVANFTDASARNWRNNGGPYMATHTLDNDWYTSRSPKSVIDRIEVPVFMAQGWQDHQVGSRGLWLYERIGTPKKLTITNGVHGIEIVPHVQNQVLRWLDYWLKGEQNGIMDEPPVTVLFETEAESRAPNFVLDGQQWPLDTTQFTPLYLREQGTLSFDPPTGPEAADAYPYTAPAGTGTAMIHDEIDDFAGGDYEPSDPLGLHKGGVPPAGLLLYQTPPLTQDLLLAGPAELALHASTTATDTDWLVGLSEVDAGGNVTFVQKGILRASHRSIDASRSLPGRPYHWHTNPQPVAPGAVVEYRVEILPFGHLFRAGSRLRLDFLTPSALPEFYWGYAASPVPAINSVHHSADTASHLLLPVVAVDGGSFPPPRPCGAQLGLSCRKTVADR